MAIRLLSPDVVGKIAAGEVVERPASVVKELVENALDAGARTIRVEIAAGGCDLIRVADDGCGIPREDLLLAVQRHATSKIATVEDLNLIDTLGFRGEALASIAAVSELTLVSRVDDAALAHEIRLRGGEQLQSRPTSRTRGTTVVVEGIFFNLPARRKFLRSATSESTQVAHLVSHLAVTYPEVAFELTIDGRRSLSTPGTGNAMDAALSVLGREVASALLPVDSTIDADRPAAGLAAHITGYVAEPKVNRATRSGIWLTVNRRPVRSRALTHAVEDAYETLLMVGRYPVAILDLRVPPPELDVNVHPTKTEVRLLRERLIYGGLRDAVRSVVAVDSRWGKEVGRLASMEQPSEPGEGALPTPRLIEPPLAASSPGPSMGTAATGRRIPILRLIGQVAQSYIVAEGEAGLYLIDQHAAHERVILERLMKGIGREEHTQLLLEPALLELTPGQWEVARAAWEALESLGFRIEPFGESSVLVRGIPGQLPPSQAIHALEQTLEDLQEDAPGGDWRERMAVALSCRGAVKAGQTLSFEEMRALVEALEETDITQHCSHGRPTAVLLSHRQLEREFGRK
jgi:DNA mismatch repair protein MutL